MKKLISLILAAVLIVTLLGLYGCRKAGQEETEPTVTTEATAATENVSVTKKTNPEGTTPETTQGNDSSDEDKTGASGSSSAQQTGNSGSNPQCGGSGGSSGSPATTQPPTTNSPSPTQHVHSYTLSSTTPATCTASGSSTYTCSCGDSYTETIPQTEHNWVHHHQDEVKHQEFKCVCQCGAQFGSEPEWAAHAKSFGNVEAVTNHGGWGSAPFWIIDTPAKDWDECSICGATK